MRNWFSLLLTVGLLLIFNIVIAENRPRPVIMFGEDLPEIPLTMPNRATDRTYLGLQEGASFLPSQIDCEVLLIEVLNVHCLHCQAQAPAFNELFKMIDDDPATRGRIKLLGIAVGNVESEVAKFRATHAVLFPVLPDPQFATHYAWGVDATPFAVFVRQDRTGAPGVVAGTHLGLNTDYHSLFEELQRDLGKDISALRREGALAERQRANILPVYSEDELQKKVREGFLHTGGQIELFRPLELRSGRRVYVASMRVGEDQVRLFAEVVSRQSVCDICHDLHFIYIFDRSGRIVGFEPLQVTKYGNVLWNAAEVEQMRRRLVGQYLAAPRPFDPTLDAVTTATISSAIIFDSIAQGESLLEELRGEGLL